MSKTNIEKPLSEQLENILSDFFAKSMPEKLDQAKKHFDKIEIGQTIGGRFIPTSEVHFPELKTVVKKIAAYIEDGNAGKKGSQHEEFILRLHNRELEYYFAHKWQEAFQLLTPLFLTTFYLFDETGSKLLSPELREDLLRESGLDKAKKRRDICLKYLEQLLLDATVRHGGSEGFWDEKKRRQLLTNYNRFYLVLKNAKSDYEQLRKKKLTEAKIREQIQEKYMIPAECIQDIFLASKADTALQWAKRELQSDDSNEHLRNRILRQARKENKVTARNGKLCWLVDFIEGEDIGTYSFTANPKEKNVNLKYISPYTLNPPKPPEVIEI